MLIYSLPIFFFILGIIITMMYYDGISKFMLWVKASMEENDGRASGKAVSSMVMIILLTSISLYVCHQNYAGAEDFKPNQKEIILAILSTIEILIISLYGIKLAGKVKLSHLASIFTKSEPEDEEEPTTAPLKNETIPSAQAQSSGVIPTTITASPSQQLTDNPNLSS